MREPARTATFNCQPSRRPFVLRWLRPRAEKRFIATVSILPVLLFGVCDWTSVSGYNEPRGYDDATLKLVFSMDADHCINRFTYDSKLAPSHPEVVSCDSPAARIRSDGFSANAPECIRSDYEWVTRDHRAYYCLKYLVRVGYCYPAVTRPNTAPVVLLYAPSACDESLPWPQVSGDLVPWVSGEPPKYEFARFVVTDIKRPADGNHCASASVDLGVPEVIGGPRVPPADSELVCLAPK
jgi:hypothetical protein